MLLGWSFGGEGTRGEEGTDGVLTRGEVDELLTGEVGGFTAGDVRRVVSPVAVELSVSKGDEK